MAHHQAYIYVLGLVCPTADHVVFADLISLLEKKLGFGPFHPNIAAAAKPRGQIISTTIFRLLGGFNF